MTSEVPLYALVAGARLAATLTLGAGSSPHFDDLEYWKVAVERIRLK